MVASADVMLVLVLLDPHPRVREEIDAVRMIPMDVRDDDVGDVLRTHTGTLHRGGGRAEVHGLPALHELVAIESGVHEYRATIAANQPDGHGDVHSAARVGAGNEPTYGEAGDGRVANRVDVVCGGWLATAAGGAGQQNGEPGADAKDAHGWVVVRRLR
jgi:hypothetical protein